MKNKLIIKINDDQALVRYLNDGESVVFGRSENADYTLNDNLVSRMHFRLSVSSVGSLLIADMGSSNGTHVNGRIIQESVELLERGLIVVGNTNIEVILDNSPKVDSEVKTSPELMALHEDESDDDVNIDFSHKFDLAKGPIENVASLKIGAQELADRLNLICTLSSKLFQAKGEDDIVASAADVAIKLSRAERCSIIFLHQGTNLLDPVVYRYRDNNRAEESFTVSTTVIRYVIKTGESVITEDAGDDERFGISDSIASNNITSVMCVPLTGREGNILGVIYLDSTGIQGGDFDTDTLAVMAAVAHQVAVAVERVRLYSGLEKVFFGSMLALAASIEAKDRYTKGHSERVTCYSLMIADELGMSEEDRTVVELAGLLHDVGKIGVPEAVLCSSTKLSDEDFAAIKKHPEIGAAIITKIPELTEMTSIRDVAKAAMSHHEKFGGGGYPKGISGNRIPLAARILAIADTFDAITSNRTYRPGRPEDTAIEIMRDCAGTQIDPEVLEAFIRVWERGDIGYPEKVRAHVVFDPQLLKDSTVLRR